MIRCRAIALTIPALVALPLLSACNSDDATKNAAKSVPADSHTEASQSPDSSPTPTAGQEASASGKEGVEASASPVDGIGEGDHITVTAKGLNPDSGYYAAFCAKEHRAGKPVPDCTGDRSAQGTQTWITNKSGGTTPIAADGTADFELTAAPTGEAVDCTKQACVLKIFGDHSEGFEDVVDIPVTFAK